MPLIGEKEAKTVTWDKPQKRIREVRVAPDGSHAVYVIEERPDYRPVSYHSHWHNVYMPWRYFLIKVSKYGLVQGGFGGYVFFAMKRAESLDDPVLRCVPLPNVYAHGGICLGYHATFAYPKPLMGVMKFIRDFYRKTGSNWLTKTMPREIWIVPYPRNPECGADSGGGLCQWSTLPPERVMEANWGSAEFHTINEALTRCDFVYNGRVVLSEDVVNEKLAKLQGGA